MASRGVARALTVLYALPAVLTNPLRAAAAGVPRRILVAQLLQLGDTLMLAPLLAKLQHEYPQAEIALSCPPAFVPLFESRPYGVRAIAVDLRDPSTLTVLRAAGPFDLAVVPADNRFSWLAAAAGSRRIVAFEGDTRWLKNLPVTTVRTLPKVPTAFGDFAASLIEGEAPLHYRRGDWPAPRVLAFEPPAGAYAVLHVGASSPHKLWPVERWRTVLAALRERGLAAILVCGAGETRLLDEVDPAGEYLRYPGTLDLAQYWHLLASARLLLCPDTGIAHLARLVGTPTIALFGPGSPQLFGAGEFWEEMPYIALWDPSTPCRDQNRVFEKPLSWARQCWRTPAECGDPKCIRAISQSQVLAALDRMLSAAVEEKCTAPDR